VSPLAIIVIPFALILVGIVLNSFHIVHDQPAFSLENDPAFKLAAERQAHSRFFQLQRQRFLRRQTRVGQYGWLVLAVFITSSWFLYSDAVKVTAHSKQVSAIQTFAGSSENETVLSLTLSDGSNARYVLKTAEPRQMQAAKGAVRSSDIDKNFQLASVGTAVSVGSATVPLGMALNISQ
jgi:hypothetical protein